MRMTMPMQCTGCVSGLISIGGLVSGIYQGMAAAKGVEMESLALARYGPIIANGVIGIAMGQIVSGDQRTIDSVVEDMESVTPRAPWVSAEQAHAQAQAAGGCFGGCAPIMYPISGAAMTAGFEVLGYYIGRAIGHTQ